MRLFCILIIICFVSCSGKSGSTEVAQIDSESPNSTKEVVCFVYHRFGDSRYPSTNISVKDFEAHLNYLTKNNFQVLTLSDAVDYLKSDTPTRKTAVITVDDGYKSFFEKGLPLLEKYSFPATLFINTKTVGGGDYMDWKALEDAMKRNIEIGNHSHSHDYFLNDVGPVRHKKFKEEIELSQSIIFKELKIKPGAFSYPYGEFDGEMKKIVKDAGFTAATAQNSGVIFSGTDLFQCPRFPMSEAYGAPEKFAEKASFKALRVIEVSPDNTILSGDGKPVLTVVFENTDLLIKQLQCFVQGGECSFKIIENNAGSVTITLQSTKSIARRRRTLYTVTVPDKSGAWHWYSHLWVNEKVK